MILCNMETWYYIQSLALLLLLCIIVILKILSTASPPVLVRMPVVLMRPQSSRHHVSWITRISRLPELSIARIRGTISTRPWRSARWPLLLALGWTWRRRTSRVIPRWCVAPSRHVSRIARSWPWGTSVTPICLRWWRYLLRRSRRRRWLSIPPRHGVLWLSLLLWWHTRAAWTTVHWRAFVSHSHVVRLMWWRSRSPSTRRRWRLRRGWTL